jgi:hypothetical protein
LPVRSNHRNPKTEEEKPGMDENTEIQPFRVGNPHADLDYLREGLARIHWSDELPVFRGLR